MDAPLDDIELMRRLAARDQQALMALYQQHGKAVYSLAYRILQNSTLAEEATQDVFFKVWRQTTQWDPNKGKLKNWLLAITQFTAIDRLRQERRQPTLHPDPIEDTDESMLKLSSNDALWLEGTALRLLLTQLPEEQARLIDLAFYQGMTHTEIADATKLPLGTVKSRLRSALQRLRELWLESANQTSIQP
jgi:RNA polymerase sigma-70 factor (ECF subfamily)